MGQRLNIEIMKDNKVLANAYYHWAAYTGAALELCQCIIDEIKSESIINPTSFIDTPFRREQIEFAQNIATRFGDKVPEITTVTMPGTVSSADRDVLYAVRLLEGTGAGINEGERKRILAEGLCPGIAFRSVIDRNCGLISITEEGMEETRCCQEGQVTIDLDRRRIYFGVFFEWSTLEDYIEEYEIDPEEPGKMPVTINESIDIENFPFEDVQKMLDLVNQTEGFGILLPDGRILSWIA